MTERSTQTLDELRKVKLQAIRKIDTLPSLSTVIDEFLQLASREYFTARDFERVLAKDQALVARLLKIANSCSFGASRTIRTIPEAVVVVGLDNIKSIIYAVSTGRLLRRELRCYRYPDRGFWMHAMGVALVSRRLAEHATGAEINAEEAFVAGLLHDIAKLIIDDFLDPSGGQRHVTLAEEREVCGFDHADLAGTIMERWNIPETIAMAVRYHHEPRRTGSWCPGAAIVNLADAVCNHWRVGISSEADLEEDIDLNQYSGIMEALAIPAEQAQPLLSQFRQKLLNLDEYYLEE